jgi:hypothetical protein
MKSDIAAYMHEEIHKVWQDDNSSHRHSVASPSPALASFQQHSIQVFSASADSKRASEEALKKKSGKMPNHAWTDGRKSEGDAPWIHRTM